MDLHKEVHGKYAMEEYHSKEYPQTDFIDLMETMIREPSTVFYAWHVVEEKSGTYAILRMKGDRKVLKPLEKIDEICGLSKEGVLEVIGRELAF